MTEKKAKKAAKNASKKPKNSQGSSTCFQVDKKRDAKGRFIKGYQPPTTFRDRPQDIYDSKADEHFFPKHSPRYQLRKLWSVPTDEVEKRMNDAKNNKKTPYGEYLALAQASRAVKSTRDFVETLNQAEGLPTQPIDMEITEEKKSPYDDLTVEELRKLLGEE